VLRLVLATLAFTALSAASCAGPAGEGTPAAPQVPATSKQVPATSTPPGATGPPLPSLAIRPAPDPGLETAIREGDFFRWVLRSRDDIKAEMSPEAEGDVVIVADVLPAEPSTLERIAGLPVGLEAEAIELAGRRYAGEGQALAVRVPDAAEGTVSSQGSPSMGASHFAGQRTWVVLARTPEAAADLVDDLIFRVLGRRRRGATPAPDYLIRETRYLERSGRWLMQGGSIGIDPAAERDDLAARDREVEQLVRVPAPNHPSQKHPGGEWVTLVVRPEDRGRPELARLAAELDRSAAAMAARIPLPAGQGPVAIEVAPDHVAQARHTGHIGEAVRGMRTDLVIVYHPDDLGAYRHALAQVLLERAGPGRRLPGLPVWLERGAALWLSDTWYGRPYAEWLPLLAAAEVLPTSEQLLAPNEQPDASAPLWTPAAAAVIARLPGATVADKLARVPDAKILSSHLETLTHLAVKTPRPAAAPPPTASPPGRPRPTRMPFLRGVSLAMLNSLDGGYHAPGLATRLADLRRLGVDAVSVMPFAYQPGPHSPDLSYLNDSPESETDIGLIHATRLARAAGFRVMTKPHIWVGWESWAGEIEMKTEADWAKWWAAYRRYLLHHAMLAQWAQADLYCAGVELSKTAGRPEWRRLIADVRRFYSGPVTYASNWGADLDGVRFWDLLDYVGVDSYDPLSAKPQATPEELAAGARGVVAKLGELSRRTGKPVILTEVGFAARKAAWMAPHEEGGEASEADQATAYRALFGALFHQRPAWLAGTFVWKAFSGEAGEGRRQSADFRFQGRPAEAVVREHYLAIEAAR
jgi:hypothetical protein